MLINKNYQKGDKKFVVILRYTNLKKKKQNEDIFKNESFENLDKETFLNYLDKRFITENFPLNKNNKFHDHFSFLKKMLIYLILLLKNYENYLISKIKGYNSEFLKKDQKTIEDEIKKNHKIFKKNKNEFFNFKKDLLNNSIEDLINKIEIEDIQLYIKCTQIIFLNKDLQNTRFKEKFKKLQIKRKDLPNKYLNIFDEYIQGQDSFTFLMVEYELDNIILSQRIR